MSRFIVQANWDDNAPHLTPAARHELWESIPSYQKDARTKGIPQLGAGVIFPIPEEFILCDAFAIPKHWPRGYGLDVGWNRTAAVWRAYDPDSDPRISYLYDEYYRGGEEPDIHSAAIRSRGSWIPGRIDPAARGRSQTDGKKLLTLYRKAIYGEEDLSIGIRLLGIAVNAVETGLYQLLMAQQHGTLKVMRHRCPNWLAERRLYRRDERGQIIKKNDHALDASRYGFASGDVWMVALPAPPVEDTVTRFASGGTDRDGALDWMAR